MPRDYGEPGILVTFEESAAKVTANVASLGFDLAALQSDDQLIIHTFRVDPTEIIEIRRIPEPVRRLSGDFTDGAWLRRGLGLPPAAPQPPGHVGD